MKGKAFLIVASLAVLLPLAAPPYQALAAESYETEVVSHTGIGDISIGLEEFELDANGDEVPYENNKTVLPGQKVDKIVRITNQADTAWIRAKLEYVSDDGIHGLSDGMLTLDPGPWVKAGGYYYYTEPVEKGHSIDFIKEVRIPAEWDGNYADRSFSITVTADAVQTANFTPDFTSSDPWFGTVIETCVHTAYEPAPGKDEAFSVVFEGGAEGLVRTGDDFFSNWGSLMPGDTVSDKVLIRNAYSRPATIYFRTETIADDILLKALRLEIRNGDNVLYSGTLDGAIRESVALAHLGYGEEVELTYTLSVPTELNNRYALTQTRTKWIFSVQLDRMGSSGSGGSSKKGGSTTGGPGVTPINPEDPPKDNWLPEPAQEVIDKITDVIGKIPKTGEGNTGFYLLLIMIASGTGAAMLWKKGRKESGHGQK